MGSKLHPRLLGGAGPGSPSFLHAPGAPAGPREGLSPPLTAAHCTAVSVLAGLRTAGVQHGGSMAAKQLPPRPNLDQLKHQAKELQRSAQIALHEAQTRIAREYGFASWNKLRDHVEALTLEFDAAVDAFVEAATDERSDRAERIVTLHPGIVNANLHTALVLGDAKAVDTRLERDPSLARKAGGPRGWEPIHYVCYTVMAHDAPARAEGLAVIARRHIAHRVDPNTQVPRLSQDR